MDLNLTLESAGLSQIHVEDDAMHVLTVFSLSSIQLGSGSVVYRYP